MSCGRQPLLRLTYLTRRYARRENQVLAAFVVVKVGSRVDVRVRVRVFIECFFDPYSTVVHGTRHASDETCLLEAKHNYHVQACAT